MLKKLLAGLIASLLTAAIVVITTVGPEENGISNRVFITALTIVPLVYLYGGVVSILSDFITYKFKKSRFAVALLFHLCVCVVIYMFYPGRIKLIFLPVLTFFAAEEFLKYIDTKYRAGEKQTVK